MDHCLDTLVNGTENIEVIIVDDGSTDDTATIADTWKTRYPEVVRVIHQDNKGHGGAVMAGLAAATGTYFYVVDSDDWLDSAAFGVTVDKLEAFVSSDEVADILIVNYVYEHATHGAQRVVAYDGALPKDRFFTWDEAGPFRMGQNIMMHSAIYRTQVLRDCGLSLPEHTFYVDNLFVYDPLPYTKDLFYLPVDLYRYFIGRDDQSVNESSMVKRVDELIRVTEMMAASVKLPDGAGNPKLASYMMSYLGVVVASASIAAVLAGTPEALQRRRAMWASIKETDAQMASQLHRQLRIILANLPGPIGRMICVAHYRLAQRLFHFN